MTEAATRTGTEGQVDSTDHTTGTDDGPPGSDDGSTTATSSGTEGRPTRRPPSRPGPTEPGAGDGTAADGGITVVGDDGTPVTVGQPTADLNGDGTPDTAVVKNHDGSTTGYTDADGDGHADQITQINADGSVVIAVSDGDGHWQVESTGHLDSDGKYVEDPKTGDVEADAPVTADQAADVQQQRRVGHHDHLHLGRRPGLPAGTADRRPVRRRPAGHRGQSATGRHRRRLLRHRW